MSEKTEMIEGMVDTFLAMWPRKADTKALKTGFIDTLKRYGIDDIKKGGIKYMEIGKKFPSPSDIIEAMDLRDDPEERSNFRILENVRCSECGHIGGAIEEPKGSHYYRCRRCYTGLTPAQIEQRFRDLGRMMREQGWKPDWYHQLKEG